MLTTRIFKDGKQLSVQAHYLDEDHPERCHDMTIRMLTGAFGWGGQVTATDGLSITVNYTDPLLGPLSAVVSADAAENLQRVLTFVVCVMRWQCLSNSDKRPPVDVTYDLQSLDGSYFAAAEKISRRYSKAQALLASRAVALGETDIAKIEAAANAIN